MANIDLLVKVPLFQDLEPRELENLAKGAITRPYNDGAAIVEEGESGTAFYVVVSGQAEVIKGRGKDDAIVLGRLVSGDYFGEMAILEHYVRSASVVARGPVQCLLLTEWDFMAALRSDPEASIKLLRRLSRRLRELDQKLTV